MHQELLTPGGIRQRRKSLNPTGMTSENPARATGLLPDVGKQATGEHVRNDLGVRQRRRARRSQDVASAIPKTHPPRSPGQEVVLNPRSEEHTSELQSRFDLVCRLLLEKNNK